LRDLEVVRGMCIVLVTMRVLSALLTLNVAGAFWQELG